ncbi:MAG: alpha-ketoacid dehydrogenase subunit alpha/beta [Bacteroidota bacterium]
MFLTEQKVSNKEMTFSEFRKEVLGDYKLAHIGRQVSILGRKEVLSGKAKFGIFGDGKEIAQIAFAKQFKNGDWRSGYYRDHIFMMAAGLITAEEFFAQLYGDTDSKRNPGNGGRNFNNHFSTRTLNDDGTWKDLTAQKNSAADLSPTAGQMPRLIGLAHASRLFRNVPELAAFKELSENGNEVAFGTIGDASTSEGHFFEVMNAAAVMQIPLAMAVWDDGYGISVPREVQTVKSSISEALKGFEKEAESNGIQILKGRGWDYPGLCKLFAEGVKVAREQHVPVLFHIDEMVQPLGHSTSGSHERYKSPERLNWEKEYDPLVQMRKWIIEKDIATSLELDSIEENALNEAMEAKNRAWKDYTHPILKERDSLIRVVEGKNCICKHEGIDKIAVITKNLKQIKNPIRKDVIAAAKKILRYVCHDCEIRKSFQKELIQWLNLQKVENYERYNDRLHVENEYSALNVELIKPQYSDNPEMVHGRIILRDNFDRLFEKYPKLVTFGEDSGKIGDVNQGLEGLQEKYGELRVSDTGIREASIIGQGIGLALRGLRPIAEIQYFDYLLYGLQPVSDDLATTHWRTKGGQSVPLIIRTRGHRLEGIWHSGSPLGMVINAMRGVFVCVPRDFTQAAGMYNTLLKAQDPALVIEPLNGYRLRELYPENIGEYTVPLGVPEIVESGGDITLVTYGSCVRIARDAAKQLRELNIHVEIIDVQTLLPFDINESIVESIKKTNRVIFFDEDVPGGATAYMMQKVLEEQGGWKFLDAAPRTISGEEHRPAYSTDGDYFSNPNVEDVFEIVYQIMHDVNPEKYPALY